MDQTTRKSGMKNAHRGRYNNDYSPQYSDPYDIYDKAKDHMKQLKKEKKEKKTLESFDDESLY